MRGLAYKLSFYVVVFSHKTCVDGCVQSDVPDRMFLNFYLMRSI